MTKDNHLLGKFDLGGIPPSPGGQLQQLLKDSFNGKEPSRCINPNEAVFDDGVVLLHVTPLSLRMEIVGGILTRIIPREKIIPAKKSQIFSTHQDKQPAVTAFEFSRVSVQ